jgi:hypothetical protein
MKKVSLSLLLLLLSVCFSISYSQSVTTGIFSGINFSDIHGTNTGGKWSSKPGPSEGLSLGYSFGKTIGIQTGIGFSAVSYEHKSQYYQYPPVYFDLNSVSPLKMSFLPFYYGRTEMDFTFVRIPLLLTVSVPSALQFNMRAGMLFSFVRGNTTNPGYSAYPDYYSYNDFYYSIENFKKRDFGFLFSSGISYPLNDHTDLSLNFNYVTGRRKVMDNSSMRHGASEITLGVDYNFLKKNKHPVSSGIASDSASNGVTVTYIAGLNYSWSSFEEGAEKYSPFVGPSLGFSVNFPLGHNVFFVTGVSFERKGYALKDSSESFYRYQEQGNQEYWVNTKVITDYAVVPLLISLPLGKSPGIFFNTGPWLGLKLNSRTVGEAYSEINTGSVYRLSKNVVYDDIENVVNDYDIGWMFSGGYSVLVFNSYKVDLSAQLSTGFNDMFNKKILSDYDPTSRDQKLKLRTVSIRIGITLPTAKF